MSTWVYIVSADNGPVKVGYSSAPRLRLLQFQAHSPNRISLECVAPGNGFLEGRLKHRWRAHRLWGEWFKPDAAVRRDIEALKRHGADYFITRAETIFGALGWPEQVAAGGLSGPNELSVVRWAAEGLPADVQDRVLLNYSGYAERQGCDGFCALPFWHPAASARAAGLSLGPILDWPRLNAGRPAKKAA